MAGEAEANLLILGVYLKSEGYPNVKYRVQALKEMGWLKVTEVNIPMWPEKQVGKGGVWRKLLLSAWRLFFSHLVVLYRFIRACPAHNVYIPYPAVFVAVILSFLPKRYQPKKVVIDAFISLYDTVVHDRRLFSSKSIVAKLLKKTERRAFKFADIVVTDTDQNSAYYSHLFELPLHKFVAVPLSTNENDMQLSPYKPSSKAVNVLFVGTLVPLHGIETILQAITLLQGDKNIEFTIIGDGQDGRFVEEYLKEYPDSITWIKTWQSASQIAKYIYEADICLGVFGRGPKTQRVCPYKIYSYALCGRAIVTAETDWTRKAFDLLDKAPFETIPVANAKLLAGKIDDLAGNETKRKNLAYSASDYYLKNLSNENGNGLLRELFESVSSANQK
jgi:glycosyltransferase involved in cell wall biosynthesis